MPKIIYKFCDGTQNEVETHISGEIENFFAIFNRKEDNAKRNNRRRKKKYLSLDRLKNELDFEPEDPTANVENLVIKREQIAELGQAVSKLNEKQQKLIRLYYYKGLTETEVAEDFGVSQPAICQQLNTIHNKLKKHLS